MTRQDYILHLDHLRQGVQRLIDEDRRHKELNGPLVGATMLEEDRAKKTQKMFEDLTIRLYEDAGVSEKVRTDKLMAGDLEQAEFTLPTIPDNEDGAGTEAKPKGRKKGGAK